MKSITVECPDQLHEQLQKLVQTGWVKSPQDAMIEALRRFLDSRHSDVREAQLLKDVEWGLRGHD
jgi:Arc/MetJ-type ribon-helix-helix transcriptional regulator